MIVVDVETSGLAPARHSIVSIGAVDFSAPDRQFYRECRVWDGAEADPEALAVNGFSMEQIADPERMPLEQAVAQFCTWAAEGGDFLLAGHNTHFDYGFLANSCSRYRMSWPFGHRLIDMHSVAWAHMAREGKLMQGKRGAIGLRSDAIYAYVGLPEEPKPHHGLTGALMEAEAFSRLLYGRNLLSEYSQYALTEAIAPETRRQAPLID
jgi:DNA polymerase III epsilon subunit-like protein